MTLKKELISQMVDSGRVSSIAEAGDPVLGPLSMLPGTWKNTGSLDGFALQRTQGRVSPVPLDDGHQRVVRYPIFRDHSVLFHFLYKRLYQGGLQTAAAQLPQDAKCLILALTLLTRPVRGDGIEAIDDTDDFGPQGDVVCR